jgi:hypothetical protein
MDLAGQVPEIINAALNVAALKVIYELLKEVRKPEGSRSE